MGKKVASGNLAGNQVKRNEASKREENVCKPKILKANIVKNFIELTHYQPHRRISSKVELLDILFMVSIMATNFQLTMFKSLE